VPQIALVSNEHDNDVGVGMVPELLQPPGDVVVGLVLADVVDEQSTNGTAIVRRRDGPVPFLTRGIPDLRLDRLGVDLDGASRELDTDGRLGVQVELVAGETAQQVGLADTGVSDEHNCIGKGITSQLRLHWHCNRAKGEISSRGGRRGIVTFEEKLRDVSNKNSRPRNQIKRSKGYHLRRIRR